jgi:hypothetical protein
MLFERKGRSDSNVKKGVKANSGQVVDVNQVK